MAVDSFSKFCWLCPVRDSTSGATVQALNTHIFQNFGFPKYIILDNTTSFSSHSFCNFCFPHGIRHNTLSPYHPQPSLAERCNRNLKASLIAFHSRNQSTWDESLPWLQIAFNSAKHESTGRSPFEVMFKFTPSTHLTCA